MAFNTKLIPQTGKLEVKVFSPYQTFFKGSALSLTAINTTGEFDILYNHINFFSLLSGGIVKVNTGFEEIRIEIQGGFIKVTNNNVTVFANL